MKENNSFKSILTNAMQGNDKDLEVIIEHFKNELLCASLINEKIDYDLLQENTIELLKTLKTFKLT